jgi:hypothetical protein
MRLREVRYLLDLNVLIALTSTEHDHYRRAMEWFDSGGCRDWGLCPFTEAGFIRVTTNPKVGSYTVEQATNVLIELAKYSGYRFWPVSEGWATITAPFRERVFGHQQITDAYLLGLAVKENGVLVTMDKTIKYLAGEQYEKNVLVLE